MSHTPGTPEYERRLEWKRAWARQNIDKIRIAKREYERAHPEKKAQWQRRYHLKRKYGISLEQYEERCAKQNGCSICGTQEAAKLHVDHHHASGELRGLLCGRCNRGLGMFDDNADRLRDAIRYLEDHD